MSLLHKIKTGARWLHQNQKTIEAAMQLNVIYGKSVLRDACKIAKAIDEPLKVPTIGEVWKHIQPLLPSKQELIENAFSNCIQTEENYRLMSQTVNFLATRNDSEVTSLIFHGEDHLTFALRINSKPYTGYVSNEYIYISGSLNETISFYDLEKLNLNDWNNYPKNNKECDDFTFYEIESFALWYMHEHDAAICEDDELFVAS